VLAVYLVGIIIVLGIFWIIAADILSPGTVKIVPIG